MNEIQIQYDLLCSAPSDINEHLSTLYKYAAKCETIFETGVRGCVSTWALALGLLHNNSSNKKILLNDITPCNIDYFLQCAKKSQICVQYIWEDNLKLRLTEHYDLIFIDTWHIYGQLIRELNNFSKNISKYIILHDTAIDGIQGECKRQGGHNSHKSSDALSKDLGWPVEDFEKGLLPAIQKFLSENQNWKLHEQFDNNNGLTVLKRI